MNVGLAQFGLKLAETSKMTTSQTREDLLGQRAQAHIYLKVIQEA